MKKTNLTLLIVIVSTIIFSGCVANSKDMIIDNEQSLKLRSYQTKEYGKEKVIVARAVVSTLQDLSFIIDKADMPTGTVTATKLVKGASMRMTIITREKNKTSTQVRANAQFSSFNQMPETVTEPEVYQSFYTALDKAIFLENAGL